MTRSSFASRASMSSSLTCTGSGPERVREHPASRTASSAVLSFSIDSALLLEIDDFNPAILRPGGLVAARRDRPLGAVAYRGQLRLGGALQQHRAPHGLCAPLAETDVVFTRAALVRVPLEAHLY